MILVSDASALVDVGYVGGLEVLSAIAPVGVLDVVLLGCEDSRQPGLIDLVRDVGVTEIVAESDWLERAVALKTADLSITDALSFYYASQNGHKVLATDRPLRERCHAEGVEVHGMPWIAQEAWARSLLERDEACRWLRVWAESDSRLPATEVKALEEKLLCK